MSVADESNDKTEEIEVDEEIVKSGINGITNFLTGCNKIIDETVKLHDENINKNSTNEEEKMVWYASAFSSFIKLSPSVFNITEEDNLKMTNEIHENFKVLRTQIDDRKNKRELEDSDDIFFERTCRFR